MTINECLGVCFDAGMCKVKVVMWHDYPDDIRSEGVVWKGMGDEIPDKYGDMEFDTYDIPKASTMTFNVHKEHDTTMAEEMKKHGRLQRPGKSVRAW